MRKQIMLLTCTVSERYFKGPTICNLDGTNVYLGAYFQMKPEWKWRPLTEKEWVNHNNPCKFEHLYEDQDHCDSCGISVRNLKDCKREIDGYENYISQFAENKSLQILMTT